jgi:hypothetical protein
MHEQVLRISVAALKGIGTGKGVPCYEGVRMV